jgi:hypothetical protein
LSSIPYNIVREAVGKTHKAQAKWTIQQMPVDTDWFKPYELTDEEKEGLGPVEQEVWKALKTTEMLDLESEIMDMLSAEICKEMDAQILKEMLRGT